jgi:hypothetical protein
MVYAHGVSFSKTGDKTLVGGRAPVLQIGIRVLGAGNDLRRDISRDQPPCPCSIRARTEASGGNNLAIADVPCLAFLPQRG